MQPQINLSQFKILMSDLRDEFKKPFSDRKTNLFWDDVKHLGYSNARRVFDHLIGNCRMSPTLMDLRNAISINRERIHDHQKQIESRQYRSAAQFLTREQKLKGFEFIGNHFDNEKTLGEFHERLNQIIDYDCKSCEDSGVVTQSEQTELGKWKYQTVSKCHCKFGQLLNVGWPTHNHNTTTEGDL